MDENKALSVVTSCSNCKICYKNKALDIFIYSALKSCLKAERVYRY